MTARLPILMLAAAAALSAEDSVDLMRFTNGDLLHGSFRGIDDAGGVKWKRDDMDADARFDGGKIRQIVLRQGRPATPLNSHSHIALIHGDRFPGVITALDESSVTLDTEYAGQLKIPRNLIGMIAPNPFGGRLFYQGPHAADEWRIVDSSPPEEEKAKEEMADENADKPAKEPDAAPAGWNFSGAAWYWSPGRPGMALVREGGIPDRAIMRCHLAWKSDLSVAIAFHADFKTAGREEAAGGEEVKRRRFSSGDSAVFPQIFGNSYVLHLTSNYMMLYRCSQTDDGNPVIAVAQGNRPMQLREARSAIIELRCNRDAGAISLFIDDEFICQWSEQPDDIAKAGYAGKGDGFGFMVHSANTSIRISDILVAEWNGMPDSARSLQVDDQDIVLLSNGTDRFSGKVGGLVDGNLILEGKYGSFRFPMADVAEVRFARDSLLKDDRITTGEVKVRLHPLGIVSGKPLSGDQSTLRLTTAGIGEWNLDLDAAVLLDFQSSTSFLDEWDPEF
jgi:hypothetical protein